MQADLANAVGDVAVCLDLQTSRHATLQVTLEGGGQTATGGLDWAREYSLVLLELDDPPLTHSVHVRGDARVMNPIHDTGHRHMRSRANQRVLDASSLNLYSVNNAGRCVHVGSCRSAHHVSLPRPFKCTGQSTHPLSPARGRQRGSAIKIK